MAQGLSQISATLIALLRLSVFTVLVPCSVTVWLPFFWFYPGAQRGFSGIGLSSLGAMVVIALGAAGYLWCAWEFTFQGKGMPAPIDHPKILVVRGLYRFVRNPMYISVFFVLLGESLLFRSLVLLRYAVIIGVLFHVVVIVMEEPMLRAKFGASYGEYRKVVPRWIPRFRPIAR
jgi:protein-S-isoprenylcysteine O-methyltransferase Ste14